MKIAILYSGHLRSFNLVKSSHLKLIQELNCPGNDVKVFCQTWDSFEANTNSWWGKSEEKFESDLNEVELLVKILKPTAYSILSQKDVELSTKPDFYCSDISFSGIESMFLAFNEVSKLLKSYCDTSTWQPDCIIRIRYDIDFDSSVFVNGILNFADNNLVCFESNIWSFANAISDVLFAFPYNLLNSFLNALENFRNHNILKLYFKRYKLFVPELFISNFVFNGINRVYINDDIFIVRALNSQSILISKKNISLNKFENFCYYNSNRVDCYTHSGYLFDDLFLFIERFKVFQLLQVFKSKNLLIFYINQIKFDRFRTKAFFQVFRIKNYNSYDKNTQLDHLIFRHLDNIYFFFKK